MNAKTDGREYRTLPAERKARRGEGGLEIKPAAALSPHSTTLSTGGVV